MRKYMGRLLTLLATSALLTLAGCSKPVLDWRNAQQSNGVIYAGDSNTPFSGTVTHAPIEFIAWNADGFQKSLMDAGNAIHGSILTTTHGGGDIDCTFSVRNGYLDGKTICSLETSDEEIIEANFSKGSLSGKFVYFNPIHPDQKLIDGSFDQGLPDGEQKIYSFFTGALHIKKEWSDGIADGRFVVYNETNGKVTMEASFDKGKLDGICKKYTPDGKQLTILRRFKDGQLDGVEEDFDPETGKRTVLVDKWVDNKIEGERKTWNPNGALTKDEIYANGTLVKSKDVSTDDTNQMIKALSGPVSVASPPREQTASAGAASASTTAVIPADTPDLGKALASAAKIAKENPNDDGFLNGEDDTSLATPVFAGRISPGGYPVYALWCDFTKQQCTFHNGMGNSLLTPLVDAANGLTPIRNADVLSPAYHCRENICMDSQNQVVGTVSLEMRNYLAAHPHP